jgi:hypothetical protein
MTNEKAKAENDLSGEELFQMFLDGLQNENEYRFSSPWRSKGSISVVVPIIVTEIERKRRTRKYVTLQETSEIITDSGSIGGVKVTNNGRIPIYVKLGSVFRGNGTQSRAVNKSLFIEAGETIDVTVNCIHASHGISRGSTFSSDPNLASPAFVEAALLKSRQHEVWSRVAHYNRLRGRAATAANERSRTLKHNDDLVGSLSSNDTFARMIKEISRDVPNHEGQVGIVVIDEKGVYGLEMFDSPESWKALYKGMISKYAEVMVGKVNEKIIDVKVNPEKVKSGIAEFISRIKQSQHMLSLEKYTTIIRIHDRNAYGELVFYNGAFVHLTAIRNDDESLKSAINAEHIESDPAVPRR